MSGEREWNPAWCWPPAVGRYERRPVGPVQGVKRDGWWSGTNWHDSPSLEPESRSEVQASGFEWSFPLQSVGETDPNGLDPHAPGAKLDAGKVMPWLCIAGFAHALAAVADVTTKGARKYTPNGWATVQDGEQRYMEAFARHMLALGRGEQVDPDTQCLHKAQMIWNLLASLELELRKANGERPRGPTDMSYAEFARDLRRLADELESGRYKHVNGGMDIALNGSGDCLTVTADLELQRAVPVDHALWAPPGLRAVEWTDTALPGARCMLCVLRDASRCHITPCRAGSNPDEMTVHPSGKNVYFVKA